MWPTSHFQQKWRVSQSVTKHPLVSTCNLWASSQMVVFLLTVMSNLFAWFLWHRSFHFREHVVGNLIRNNCDSIWKSEWPNFSKGFPHVTDSHFQQKWRVSQSVTNHPLILHAICQHLHKLWSFSSLWGAHFRVFFPCHCCEHVVGNLIWKHRDSICRKSGWRVSGVHHVGERGRGWCIEREEWSVNQGQGLGDRLEWWRRSHPLGQDCATWCKAAGHLDPQWWQRRLNLPTSPNSQSPRSQMTSCWIVLHECPELHCSLPWWCARSGDPYWSLPSSTRWGSGMGGWRACSLSLEVRGQGYPQQCIANQVGGGEQGCCTPSGRS